MGRHWFRATICASGTKDRLFITQGDLPHPRRGSLDSRAPDRYGNHSFNMVKTPSTQLELGSGAPAFNPPNTNREYGGDTVSLPQLGDHAALLVVFMCNHCPYVIHIIESLVAVVKQYQPQGLAMVAISVNDIQTHPDDAPDRMTATAAKYGFTFPYLYDESQQSAKDYRATCTPDLFLYDENQRLVYHGQYDSSRPGSKVPVTGEDLKGAIDHVLSYTSPPLPQAPSVGCSIKWKPGQAP